MITPEQAYVMVIEDDTRSSTLAKQMLTLAGVTQISVCTSAAEALQISAELPRVDLILLDLQLPVEDGFRAFERLREAPKTRATPITAFTAQMMSSAVERADAMGFSGFLGKPLNYDRFPDQIRRLLNGEKVWEPR